MKKVFATLLAFACFATASFAQAKKTEKVEVKKEVAAAPKTKADGTPDKRFKAAEKPAAVASAPAKKEVAAPAAAPKMKADGTPDKRFKDAKTTAPANAGPTKKDGTLDMRYKANKDGAKKKA